MKESCTKSDNQGGDFAGFPKLGPVEFLCKDVTVVFRPMEVDDYGAVRDLVPLVSRCFTRFSSQDVQALLALPTYHPWCAIRKDTGALVGFVELLRLPHIGRQFDGRLERVVVSENFRNRGLATMMCEYLITQAKEVLNCGRIELTVEKENARHIYEQKLQFVPVSTTVMRRMLD